MANTNGKTGLLVAERHQEIAETIARQKSARVADFARQFQVTEETIRRDLEKLEGDGKLLRSHGGAIAIPKTSSEKTFSERTFVNVREKSAIAREAVKLIKEGQSLIFDASSTALAVAQLVPDIRVTVITNAINVAVELSGRAHVRVVCIGGMLSSPSLSFSGPRAEQFLSDYHVDHAFLSCTAVDVEFGLSDINEGQALLKKAMMHSAGSAVLLADHTKFGLKSLRAFAPISEISHVITDDKVDYETLLSVRGAGPIVTVASEYQK